LGKRRKEDLDRRRKQVYLLLRRGLTTDAISRQLSTPYRTIQRDIAAVKSNPPTLSVEEQAAITNDVKARLETMKNQIQERIQQAKREIDRLRWTGLLLDCEKVLIQLNPPDLSPEREFTFHVSETPTNIPPTCAQCQHFRDNCRKCETAVKLWGEETLKAAELKIGEEAKEPSRYAALR